MNWNISILKELKESNLSSISNWLVNRLIHFNSCIAVIKDALLDSVLSLFTNVTLCKGIFSVVNDLFAFAVELSHLHFIFG